MHVHRAQGQPVSDSRGHLREIVTSVSNIFDTIAFLGICFNLKQLVFLMKGFGFDISGKDYLVEKTILLVIGSKHFILWAAIEAINYFCSTGKQ
jgi:hypothetical protein